MNAHVIKNDSDAPTHPRCVLQRYWVLSTNEHAINNGINGVKVYYPSILLLFFDVKIEIVLRIQPDLSEFHNHLTHPEDLRR